MNLPDDERGDGAGPTESAAASEGPPVDDSAEMVWPGWFLVLLIVLGIALRIGLYVRNRALWLDEAFLALNLTERSFTELFDPLSYDQSAPLGFLLAVKAAMAVFGASEYGLRALPLVAGVISMPLMYVVARKSGEISALPIVLGVFALSFPLIRYASELKQYSSDVAVVLVLYTAALYALEKPGNTTRNAVLAILGAGAVWCSHPSTFVLGGIGLVLAGCALFRKEWPALGWIMGAIVFWSISFGLNYWISLRFYAGNEALRSWWTSAYMPFPPSSPTAVKWLLWTFVSLFEHPLGLALPGLGALAFLVGSGVLWRRRPVVLAMLLTPMFLALAASALQRYPFTERFLLFLAPALALVVAAGVREIVAKTWPRSHLIVYAFVALLFAQPVLVAANELYKPAPEGVRPLVRHLAEHQAPGDGLYLYHWAQYEIRYYAAREGLDLGDAVTGITSRNDWAYYRKEVETFQGRPRVWFAFIDVPEYLGGGEEKFFRTLLNEKGTLLDEEGTQLESQTWKKARLYLYDLSVNAAPPAKTPAEPQNEPQDPEP